MSLISVNNLTFGYDGSLKNIFENVSFNIDTDWKLGLIGRNGKGKTTFLKLLLGKYEYQGAISKNVEFDYFPFEVKNKERMAIEIVNEIAPNVEDWEIIRELNLLNTDTEVLYRSFNLLSGGEQIKILLISLFLKGNNFLLIDEPTNHLDIETRNNLVNYLEKKKGFILVSHDRNFLDKVVNHIISINNTNIEIQQGNFSSWKENKNRQDNFEKIQNERLQKDINRLEIASKNCAKWSNEAEKTKNKKYNSETTIDKGYIGHKADKMMKKSKVMEQRIEKAINEKTNLLKNIEVNDTLKIIPLKSNKNPLIFAHNLQIKYSKETIFNPITFEVNNGDRVALIGKNGILNKILFYFVNFTFIYLRQLVCVFHRTSIPHRIFQRQDPFTYTLFYFAFVREGYTFGNIDILLVQKLKIQRYITRINPRFLHISDYFSRYTIFFICLTIGSTII